MRKIALIRQSMEILSLAAVIALSLYLAFLVRFDFRIPDPLLPAFREALVLALLVKLTVFLLSRLNHGVRRFAAIQDVPRLGLSNLAASAALWMAVRLLPTAAAPNSIPAADLLICFLLTSVRHFSVRLYREVIRGRQGKGRPKGILVYGAGAAGAALVRDTRSGGSAAYEVLGFLDDDPAKRGARILGVPVLGSGREAAAIVDCLNQRRRRVEETVIAMPSVSGVRKHEAVANCRAARVPCTTLPGLDELLSGKVTASQIRGLSVSDLLGRKPVELDDEPIRASLTGRAVLITGAAGSIGSELCRQVARFRPGLLVAFDQAESELFKIENELRDRFPKLELVATLGDVRNPRRAAEQIERHGIESIFHAAAYKHVPMLETHVLEAVHTNILGTWNLLNAARKRQVSNFVLISTDKAVNPTNVMGATKRVCELLVCAQQPGQTTRCVAVRFGNVLGSNGSVVPLFQSQIAAGGPVRVTHPDMQRYFMTISEAVALVLQASTMGRGSEIFVLDMGEPVRILDLAENMIRLAGLEPYQDIDIEFTGLRPGEKLFEEIKTDNEDMLPTYHDKVHIFADPPADPAHILRWVAELDLLVRQRNTGGVMAHIRRLVPEYRPDGKWAAPHEATLLPAVGANLGSLGA